MGLVKALFDYAIQVADLVYDLVADLGLLARHRPNSSSLQV